MDGTMVTKDLTEEQRRYCITECAYGKKKAQELLSTCESIFDAVEDMRTFTQKCIGSSKCTAPRAHQKIG